MPILAFVNMGIFVCFLTLVFLLYIYTDSMISHEYPKFMKKYLHGVEIIQSNFLRKSNHNSKKAK